MMKFSLFYSFAIVNIALMSMSHATADTFASKLACKKFVDEYKNDFPRVDGFTSLYPKYDEKNGRCLVYIYAKSNDSIVERVDDALTHSVLASNVLYIDKPMSSWSGKIDDNRYSKTFYGRWCSVSGCDTTGYLEAQDYINLIKKMD